MKLKRSYNLLGLVLSFTDFGNSTKKEDPLLISVLKYIFPLCESIICFTIANPRPVPVDFVVKFG